MSSLQPEIWDVVVSKLSCRDQARVACVDRAMNDRVHRLGAFQRVYKTVYDSATATFQRLRDLTDVADSKGGDVAGMDALEATARAMSSYYVRRRDDMTIEMDLPHDVSMDAFEATVTFRVMEGGRVFMSKIVPPLFDFTLTYTTLTFDDHLSYDIEFTMIDNHDRPMYLSLESASGHDVAVALSSLMIGMHATDHQPICIWWPAFTAHVHAMVDFIASFSS